MTLPGIMLNIIQNLGITSYNEGRPKDYLAALAFKYDILYFLQTYKNGSGLEWASNFLANYVQNCPVILMMGATICVCDLIHANPHTFPHTFPRDSKLSLSL